MNREDFLGYVAAERERLKTPREREIQQQISETAKRYRIAFDKEIEPLIKELTDIEMRKPMFTMLPK